MYLITLILFSQLVDLTSNYPLKEWEKEEVHEGDVCYCSFSPDSTKIISCADEDECQKVCTCVCLYVCTCVYGIARNIHWTKYYYCGYASFLTYIFRFFVSIYKLQA